METDTNFADFAGSSSLTRALEEMDDGPTRCSVCGTGLEQDDIDYSWLPVEVPVGTLPLMSDSEDVEISDDVVGLRLRFCSDHWSALTDRLLQPGALSFGSFDAKYVGRSTISENSRINRRESPRTAHWDQDKLRLARATVAGETEIDPDDVHELRRALEATLLVTAVDGHGLAYGPVEQAKRELVTALRTQGVAATVQRDPWVDVEVELEGMETPVAGSIFIVSKHDTLHDVWSLTTWKDDPERLVSGALYYSLLRQNFAETVADTHPGAQHIGFYWLAEQETWRWCPFPASYDRSFGSGHRSYLPIVGPTQEIPAPPLDALSQRTATPDGFERLLADRWHQIEADRPARHRLMDRLRRRMR